MTDESSQRDPVEALASEYVERIRRGEKPSLTEYTRAYPELASEIIDLFPTIAGLEHFKQDRLEPATPAASSDQPERMGDFRIVREIGRGGMGIVYQAEQLSLGRDVALKVLPPHLLNDENTLARFRREAQNAAKLHHTNIVPVLGTGEHDGVCFYVMQYIDGVALDQIIHALAAHSNVGDQTSPVFTPPPGSDKRTQIARLLSECDLSKVDELGRVPAPAPSRAKAVPPQAEPASDSATAETIPIGRVYYRNVARIGMLVANALEYAHQSGIYHRDIKPGNLILDRRGSVMVTDFGLAVQASGSDRVSRTGDVVGTPRYMAPEQLRGAADERSDVYSLGLTLYEMLTFQASSNSADTHQASNDDSVPGGATLRRLNPRIPRDLESIVVKAIATQPWRRYQTAREMAEDLSRFLSNRPIQARRVHPLERIALWRRRNPVVAALSATSFTFLLIAVVTASTGYWRVSGALFSEKAERERAEATMALTLEAFGKVSDRLAPARDSFGVGLSSVSRVGDAAPVFNENTIQVLTDLLEFYGRFVQLNNDNARLLIEARNARQRIADIHFLLGDYQAAQEEYEQLLSDDVTASSPGDRPSLVEQAQLWNKLGNVRLELRNVSGATEAHHKALDLLKNRLTDRNTDEQFALAKTFFFLGRVKDPSSDRPRHGPDDERGRRSPHRPQWDERPLAGEPAGPPDDGPDGDLGPHRRPPRRPPFHGPPGGHRQIGFVEEYIQQAIELLTMLEATHTNDKHRYMLALCYRELAPTDHQKLKDAVDILEELVQTYPDKPHYAHELSVTCSRVDRPDRESLTYLKRAVDLADSLAATNPYVTEYLVNQAHLHSKYANILRDYCQFNPESPPEMREEYEQHLREAVRLNEGLVQRFPQVPSYQFWSATAQEALAMELLRQGRQTVEIEELLTASIASFDNLAANKDYQPAPYAELARSYHRLAEYYGFTLNFVGERDAEQKHKETLQKLKAARALSPTDW